MAEVKQGNEDPSEITENIQKTLANVGHSVCKRQEAYTKKRLLRLSESALASSSQSEVKFTKV